MDMARKQVKKDAPGRDELLSFLEKRQKQITLLDGGRTNISFFAMEGLDRFLETAVFSNCRILATNPFPEPSGQSFCAECLHA